MHLFSRDAFRDAADEPDDSTAFAKFACGVLATESHEALINVQSQYSMYSVIIRKLLELVEAWNKVSTQAKRERAESLGIFVRA